MLDRLLLETTRRHIFFYVPTKQEASTTSLCTAGFRGLKGKEPVYPLRRQRCWESTPLESVQPQDVTIPSNVWRVVSATEQQRGGEQEQGCD